jgi:predicted RNA-binding protein YlxR (DUF448 family)
MPPGEPQRPRPIPQRTCIACRETAGKREFVRIVRTPEGRVIVDENGKANGRGAYLHAARQCWEKALKRGTIGVALKTTPAKDDVEALQAFCRALPADEGGDSR